MQVSIVFIYIISVPNKIDDDSAWLSGTAIYWIMMSSLWSRGLFQEVYYHAIVIAHVTFFTLGMACSFWLFVPPQTTRRKVSFVKIKIFGKFSQ